MSEDVNEIELSLVSAIASGDETAMAGFYKRFGRGVYAFSLQRIKDPVQAEEVVVETMYEVWKGARRFRGDSQVRTWVLGIARHKVLDRLRARKHVQLDEIDETIACTEPGGYEIVARAHDAAAIAKCMELLSDAHRECLHLAFFQDLSMAEIAKIQQCPANTVKTRIFHAKRNIKSCLAQLLGLKRTMS